MSDEKPKPIAWDWGDDPEHIASVKLGGDVVKLEIRDPFEVLDKAAAYSQNVNRETMGDLLACVWPEDIGDGAEAFSKVFPRYPMSDLQTALVRLSKRAHSMFPTESEVVTRAAFFPDGSRVE